MNNQTTYKGYTIRTLRNSIGKVNRAVVIGQNAEFKTIKSAKSFINTLIG